MTKPTILVSGSVHPRVMSRIDHEFTMIHIEKPEANLLNDTQRHEIAGLVIFGLAPNALLDALPNLEIISNFGVGYDGVDAHYAAQKGIMVTHTPDVLSAEVADVTIGLLLNVVRELSKSEAYLRAGRWKTEGPYPLTKLTLRNRTIGIYGLGRIGVEIAQRLEGFDVDIHYHSRNKRNDVSYHYHDTLVSLATTVDTLISVVPGGKQTDFSINKDILSALGADGVLINVGRGSAVDDNALIVALENDTIAAAGLDVFNDEPHVQQAFLDMQNVVVTPHIASASVATRNIMADLVVDNLEAWLSDKPAISPVVECAHIQKKQP